MREAIIPQATQDMRCMRIPCCKTTLVRMGPEGKAQKDNWNRQDELPEGALASTHDTPDGILNCECVVSQHVSRRFKNGFREGTTATRKVKAASSDA
jgi:hypothetical protein